MSRRERPVWTFLGAVVAITFLSIAYSITAHLDEPQHVEVSQ